MKDQLKIETKSVKHTFSNEEEKQLGGDLARTIAAARGIEAEFDQVKASYKAKTSEAEARIDSLSTALMNGFEMRQLPCVVRYRPEDKLKDYYLESEAKEHAKDFPNGCTIVLTEAMTRDDFQADLLLAESKFDAREEIQLFQPTETDNGLLVVGRFAGKWFTALRVKIGKLELSERLDSEQRSFKQRADAIKLAVKRVKEWAKDNLRDHAKGFDANFDAVIEAHKEREE